MRIRFAFSFLLLTTLLPISYGQAAFVSYTDVNGKLHYINTEYNKVPDQYLNQVEEQLKKIENTKIKNTPEAAVEKSAIENPQPPTPELTVEVFVKTDCQDCMRLQALLEAHKIKYLVYDIKNSEKGIEFYKSTSNEKFPITRIGSKIIYGNDVLAIKDALKPKDLPVQPPSPLPATSAVAPTNTKPSPTVTTTTGYQRNQTGQYFKTNHLIQDKR